MTKRLRRINRTVQDIIRTDYHYDFWVHVKIVNLKVDSDPLVDRWLKNTETMIVTKLSDGYQLSLIVDEYYKDHLQVGYNYVLNVYKDKWPIGSAKYKIINNKIYNLTERTTISYYAERQN